MFGTVYFLVSNMFYAPQGLRVVCITFSLFSNNSYLIGMHAAPIAKRKAIEASRTIADKATPNRNGSQKNVHKTDKGLPSLPSLPILPSKYLARTAKQRVQADDAVPTPASTLSNPKGTPVTSRVSSTLIEFKHQVKSVQGKTRGPARFLQIKRQRQRRGRRLQERKVCCLFLGGGLLFILPCRIFSAQSEGPGRTCCTQ